MATYDLGTAHGRIIIDYDDKGSAQAEKSMSSLDKAARLMGKAFEFAKGQVKSAAQDFIDSQGGYIEFGKKVRDVSNMVLSFHRAVNASAIAVTGLSARMMNASSAFAGMTRTTNALGRGLTSVKASFIRMGAIGEIFKGLDQMFFNIADKLYTLPDWVKGIINFQAAIASLKSGVAVLGWVRSNLDLVSQALRTFGTWIGRLTGLDAVWVSMRALGRIGGTWARGIAAGIGPAVRSLISFLGLAAPLRKMGLIFNAGQAAVGSWASRLITTVPLFAAMASRVTALRTAFGGLINNIKTQNEYAGRTIDVGRKLFQATDKTSKAIADTALFALKASIAYNAFEKACSKAAIMAFKLGAGATAAVSGIQIVGAVVAGTLNALKQLSGIFLTLPGILLGAAAVFGVVKLGFQGIGDALKAIGSGDTKAIDEALKKLSPNARDAMVAANGLGDAWRKMQSSVQDAVFTGVGDQLRELGGPILSTMNQGLTGVGQGVNLLVREMLNFAGSKKTLADLSHIFSSTQVVVQNLALSIRPLLNAFMSIGVVGLDAISQYSSGLRGASRRFDEFILKARETGQLRKWIDDAVQGFKDLGHIVSNIGAIVKDIFSKFSVSGQGALATVAAMTDKWRAFLTGAGTGSQVIDQVVQSLKNIHADYIDVLKYAFDKLWPSIQAVLPHIETLVSQVSKNLKPVIDVVAFAFAALASILDGPLGGALLHFIATCVTARLAASVFSSVVGAIIPIIAGISTVFTAVQKAGQFMSAMFGRIPGLFTAAGTSIARAGVQLGTFGSAIARVGNVIPAVAAAQDRFLRVIQMSGSTMSRYAAINNTVGRALDKFPRTFATVAGAAAGFKSTMGGLINMLGGPFMIAIYAVIAGLMMWTGHMNAVRNQQSILAKSSQEAANSTKNFAAAYREAGGVLGEPVFQEASKQISNLRDNLVATAESASTFQKLRAFGARNFGGADQAALQLVNTTETAKEAEAAIKQLGYSNDEIGRMIASQEGWNKLTSELQAMGEWGQHGITTLQQTRDNLIEAGKHAEDVGVKNMNLSQAIETLGNSASTSSQKLSALKVALQSLGLMQTTAEEASWQLAKAVNDIVTGEVSAINKSGALGDALFNMDGTIKKSVPNAHTLYNTLQGLADNLQNVAVNGGDVGAEMARMAPALAQLQSDAQLTDAQFGKFLATVGLAPKTIAILMSVTGQDEVYRSVVETLSIAKGMANEKVSFNIDVNPEAVNAVVERLRGLGMQVDVLNATTGTVRVTTQGGTEAGAMLDTINRAKTGVTNGPPAVAKVETQGTDKAKTDIQGVNLEAEGLKSPPPVEVAVTGTDQAQGALDATSKQAEAAGVGFIGMQDQANVASQGIISIFSGMSSGVMGIMESLASYATASGTSLGANFAAGIASQAGAVAEAAGALAAAASAPLPKSPAEIGPFSGKGWTPYRGLALAEGFAQGIASGSGAAKKSALDMASAVAQAIEQIGRAGYLGPDFVARAGIVGAGKYRLQEGADPAALRRENLKRIKDREESEARNRKKEEQQKRKDEAKKTPEERKAAAEAEAKKAEKGKKPEEIAKENRQEEEKKAQERLDKAMKVLEDGVSTQDEINGAIGELAKQSDATGQDTKDALAVLANENSNVEDVIKALDTVDNSIKTTEDIQTQDYLKQIADQTRTRRGIEAYDPLANASKDINKDTLDIVKNLFDILNGIKSAIDGFKELSDLLVRGISSTDDINKAIDGVQGLVSGIAGMADTAGTALTTFSNIAAAIGSVIPGVGQVTSAISAATGMLGGVNEVIDLVQEGFKIVGWGVGNLLSSLAGGAEGALYGKVRTLIDTNDMTIKRWSAETPMDKRITQLGGGGVTNNTGVNNLNIYQGPGVDPYRMIDEAMFAVKANRIGAYSE